MNKRMLTTLTLAFPAVLAASALAAPAASAEELFFTDGTTATLTAAESSVQEFNTTAGHLACEDVTGHGFLYQEITDWATFVPKYGKCETQIGQTPYNARINETGCYYTFESTTERDAEDTDPEHADVTLACPPEINGFMVQIEIFGTFFSCVTIGPQTVADAVYYETIGEEPNRDIHLWVTAESIHYTIDAKSVCNSGEEPITETNGFYTADITVKGYETETENTTDLWYE